MAGLLWWGVAIGAAAEEERTQPREAPRVVFYERANFRGAALEAGLGTRIENLQRTRFSNGARMNDTISSIYVAPGAAVRVWVDEKFQGEPITFTRSVENLAELLRGGGATWNDTISALRVEEVPYRNRPGASRDPSRAPRILLFRHPNFGGESLELFPGESFENLRDVTFDEVSRRANDEVTSMRIVGPVRVRLHSDRGFRGDTVELTADVADLRTIKRGAEERATWDDCISSIVVEFTEPAGGGERPGRDRRE